MIGVFKELAWIEKSVVGVSLFISLAACFVLYDGISLRSTFWEVGTDQLQTPVGKLGSTTGKIRRNLVQESGFKSIQTNETLYNLDTLVTSEAATTVVSLDDGSELELGPNTMVKLTFDQSLGIGGVSRSLVVGVVAGEIKSKGIRSPIRVKTKLKEIQLAPSVTPPAPIRVEPPKVEKPVVKSIVIPKEPTALAAPTPRAKIEVTDVPPPSSAVEVSSEASVSQTSAESAEEPAPAPAPSSPEEKLEIVAKSVYPKSGEKLAMPDQATSAKLHVTFSWRVTGTPKDLEVVLFPKKGEPLAPQPAKREDLKYTIPVDVPRPGDFLWKIRVVGTEEWLYESDFTMRPDFIGIETLSPLVAGKDVFTNKSYLKGVEKLDLTLRWNPFPGAKKYSVQFFDGADPNKVILSRDFTDTKATFTELELFKASNLFEIKSTLSNGFVVRSKKGEIEFAYTPPELVEPLPQKIVSLKETKTSGKPFILIWKRVSFVTNYEVEIAKDSGFKTKVLTERPKDNFFIVQDLDPGDYYWRVKATYKQLISKPSQSRRFTVVP